MAEAALNAQDSFQLLTRNDVAESIQFYKALGFEIVHKMDDDEGNIVFCFYEGGRRHRRTRPG